MPLKPRVIVYRPAGLFDVAHPELVLGWADERSYDYVRLEYRSRYRAEAPSVEIAWSSGSSNGNCSAQDLAAALTTATQLEQGLAMLGDTYADQLARTADQEEYELGCKLLARWQAEQAEQAEKAEKGKKQ